MDLHIHSMHSPDSMSRPARIVKRAVRLGLGAIAVTDHDTWKGYAEAKEAAHGSLIVVPGAELRTAKGDLLALFVEEEISTRDWAEAIDMIRAQHGLAVVPHPAMSKTLTSDDIRLADAVESFNAKCSPSSNAKARAIAEELKMPCIGSSDAHVVAAIGNGRTRVPDAVSEDDLRGALLKDPVISRAERTNPVLHYGNAALCFGLKGIWRR